MNATGDRGSGRNRGGPEARLTAILLLALAGAILGAGPDASISGIEIAPSAVMVDASQPGTVELTALVWTGPAVARLSLASAATPPLVWTVPPGHPWLAIQRQDGNRVTLQVVPQSTPPTEADVTVTAGVWSASTRLIPVGTSDQDVLEAPGAGGLPGVVVTNGLRGGECSVDAEAFVGSALLGRISGNCADPAAPWGTAILDENGPMVMLPGHWTDAPDTVRQAPTAAGRRLIPVALWVVVGGHGNVDSLRTAVASAAQDAVATANSILLENRAGLQLQVTDTKIVTSSNDSTVVADCLSGDQLVSDDDRPGVLRIYYVNSMGNARGFACAGTDDRPQSAIFISWENEASTTLVHEVGHTLGLALPGQGHVDRPRGLENIFLTGFDASNVMTSGISDWDPVGRHRLSVGQVFRMNADSASWLNAAIGADGLPAREASAPRLACQCGEADPTGYCPRLRDDVTRPGGGTGSSEPWDCHDLLRLPDPGADAAPVGVLSGRTWRAPIAHCGNEVSEYRPDHWEASYLGFGNFTRPGKCPSWAAVFFKTHGLLFRWLTEGHDIAWSDAADEWGIDDTGIPATLSVPVHLYFPASQQTQVKVAVDETQRIFGGDNRTGITLVLDLHPTSGTTEPCPASSPKGLYICDFDPSADTRSLANLVGGALGLPMLAPGEQDKAAFAGNAMHTTKDLRGGHLTLGQVFRINAFLRPGELPACASVPDPCPPLDLDVVR